jgi:hypothetical protein
MSYINTNQLPLGIQGLQETLQRDNRYKKSLYLVLALSYKKMNKISEAISIVNTE